MPHPTEFRFASLRKIARITLAGAVAVLAAAVWAGMRRAPQAAAALAVAVAFAAGFGYAALRAEWRLADALSADLEGRDVEVVGVIAGLPQFFERGLRFDFEVEQAVAGIPRRLQLAWYRGWRDHLGFAAVTDQSRAVAGPAADPS